MVYEILDLDGTGNEFPLHDRFWLLSAPALDTEFMARVPLVVEYFKLQVNPVVPVLLLVVGPKNSADVHAALKARYS